MIHKQTPNISSVSMNRKHSEESIRIKKHRHDAQPEKDSLEMLLPSSEKPRLYGAVLSEF